jgi:hypothetical protein
MLQVSVNGAPTSTVAAPLTLLPSVGRPLAVLVVVAPTRTVPAQLTGTVTITVANSGGTKVYSTIATLPKLLPLTAVTIPGSAFGAAGTYRVSVAYSGDEFYSPSSTSLSVQVHKL